MYHLLHWARTWAVGETFGFEAAYLNDDRLGRCLDALAPQIDAIQGAVLVQAVTKFQLDLRQVHWDLTSVVLDGAFDPAMDPPTAPEGQPPYPQPAYGYGGVSDQKQLRVGELVTSDGYVPVFHRAFDGNRADVGTVVALMNTVREHVRLPDCLVIGDTKLLSAAVMRDLRAQKLDFLAPLPHSPELAAEFLALPADGWQELDYLSQEQAKRPPEERHQYWGQEVPWSWQNPKTGAAECFRRLYVISSEERDARRKTRNQRLVQAAKELNALLEQLQEAARNAADKQAAAQKAATEKAAARKAAGKPEAAKKASDEVAAKEKAAEKAVAAREQLRRRAEKILAHRKVQDFLQVRVRIAAGAPELEWELDTAAITAAERLDGYYVLLCSWPAAKADAHALLRRWKQEALMERRFHEWKGPLRVRPVFVTSPPRLAAFMLLLHLALLVFCLIEREARRRLAEQQQSKIANLLAGHVAAIPTGANILIAFEYLFLIVDAGPPRECYMPPMSAVQQTLWSLLGARLPTFV
jgi:transposase